MMTVARARVLHRGSCLQRRVDSLLEWNGQAVQSVRTAFGHAVELTGLDDDVTPHTLRRTCATWLMQAGVDKWGQPGSWA
jgi:integrase